MFNASSMSFQCELCSAAGLSSLLGPASAPLGFFGTPTDSINGGLCSHVRHQRHGEEYTNPYVSGFGTGTTFTSGPTIDRSSFFTENTPKSSSSSTPSMIDQEWDSPFIPAWDNNSVTPKLIQRQLKRREQNRASQRAFRDRKEKHAKCLQEKIDDLETRLQVMDNVNAGLGHQLAELRDHRESGYDHTSKPVSPQSEVMQTSPVIWEGGSRGSGADIGGENTFCRHCGGRGPTIGKADHMGRASDESSQMFLP